MERKKYINGMNLYSKWNVTNMEIVSPEEVKQKLDKRIRGEYTDAIEQLPIGAALKINPHTWPRRESIYHYFLVRYPKRISVRKLGDGYYYVIKLPFAS